MVYAVDRRVTPTELRALLDACVADGALSEEQAATVLARGLETAATSSPPPGRVGIAAEALGYLGGAVAVVSTLLIGNQYWSDLSLAARLGAVGGGALVLFAGGLAVSPRLGPVAWRLRSVLWLACLGAVAGALALLTADGLELAAADVALTTTSTTAVVAIGLWRAHRHLVQQFACLLTLMAAASAGVARFVSPDHLPGVGAWVVAALWLGLAWAGQVGPRRPVLVGAAAAAIVASLMTLPTDGGFGLAIVTVTVVVALAVFSADLLLLAVGAVGTLLVLPAAVYEWFPDSQAVPFALLLAGLLLIAVAVWTTRRRMPTRRPAQG